MKGTLQSIELRPGITLKVGTPIYLVFHSGVGSILSFSVSEITFDDTPKPSLGWMDIDTSSPYTIEVVSNGGYFSKYDAEQIKYHCFIDYEEAKKYAENPADYKF